MKGVSAVVILAGFAFGPAGCSHSGPADGASSGGGGSGDVSTVRLTAEPVPPIKQGDAHSVKVTVERGKDYRGPIRLEVKGEEKLLANVDRPVLKDGDPTDVNVRIRPADDAPEGEHKVTLTATPGDGPSTTLELKVKVVKK